MVAKIQEFQSAVGILTYFISSEEELHPASMVGYMAKRRFTMRPQRDYPTCYTHLDPLIGKEGEGVIAAELELGVGAARGR